MALTPLHGVLGLPPSDLTFDIIAEAAAKRVTEQTALDWKQKLPDGRDPAGKDEFAKDVAAMVNSGGGMIVYGVREDASTSAALELIDVGTWTDGEERRLRQFAYVLIQPPVQNIEFIPLTDGTTTVVALIVPTSSEAPHFQMRQGSFRAPRRYGALTIDMSERDIEQAYRNRFDDRKARERSLEELANDVVLGLPGEGRVWMSAAGVPVAPRPAQLGHLVRRGAQEVIEDMRINPYLARGVENSFSYIDANPRRGFRKWRSTLSVGRHLIGAVDIHDDGSVALAYADMGSPHTEAGIDVHVQSAHRFPAYAVRLVQAAASRLGIRGGHQLLLNMKGSQEDNGELYIRTFDRGFIIDREDSVPIHHFYPVSALIDGAAEEAELLQQVRSAALDILNQAGINQVHDSFLQQISGD